MIERIFEVYVKGKAVGEIRYIDYDLGLEHRHFYYDNYRTKEKHIELLAWDFDSAFWGLIFDYKEIFNCKREDITFSELIDGRFVEINIDEI